MVHSESARAALREIDLDNLELIDSTAPSLDSISREKLFQQR